MLKAFSTFYFLTWLRMEIFSGAKYNDINDFEKKKKYYSNNIPVEKVIHSIRLFFSGN